MSLDLHQWICGWAAFQGEDVLVLHLVPIGEAGVGDGGAEVGGLGDGAGDGGPGWVVSLPAAVELVEADREPAGRDVVDPQGSL